MESLTESIVTERVVSYCRHCPPNYKNERLTIVGEYVGTTLKIGISRCSNKDQFEKRKGREIAMGRAEKCPVMTLTTSTPKKSFIAAYTEIEAGFNDKEGRENFLAFIRQNPQEEKVGRNTPGFFSKAFSYIKTKF